MLHGCSGNLRELDWTGLALRFRRRARDSAVLFRLPGLPSGRCLVGLAHFEQDWQIDSVAVALVLAQLVLVAHFDGVEIADIDADAAEDAATEVNLELVDDFAAAALTLCVQRVILHLRAHALRRAVADADHATGAVRLADFAVPCQRGEAHEAVLNFEALIRLGVLGGYRLTARRLKRDFESFEEAYHAVLANDW